MGLFGIHPFTYAPNKTTFDAPANEYVFWIDREKHGRCATCGLQTHEIKQGLFYVGSVLVPLTNEHVESGRCLACKPLNAAGASFLGQSGVASNNLSDGGLIFDPDESVKSGDHSPTHQDNISIGIHDSAAANANMASSLNQTEKSTGQSGKIIAGLSTLIVIAVGIALYFALKPNPLPDPEPITTPTPQVMPNHSNMFNDVTPNSTTLNMFDDVTSTITTPISNTSSRELPRETQVKAELEAHVLRRGITFDQLDDNDSRTSALDWLLNEDGMELPATSSNLGQRYILALLAFEFGAMFRSNVDWLSSSMECSWDWITCNDQNVATELNLASENITGTLPPEISGLLSLEVLSVWDNSLVGSIPPELGELEELTELAVGGNSLVGTLPTEIGQLKELTSLSAYYNKLSGSIPSSIGQLANLGTLWLNGNSFTSTLPTELGALTELADLRIFSNAITGTLPSKLGQLTSLTLLSLGGNQLGGTIPSWIGQIISLETLYLEKNQFTGSLPTELGNLVRLTDLDLSYNQLSSTLPSELSKLVGLTILRLNDNQFTGTIPSSMGELTSLEELYLENNKFTGHIPSSIEELAELATEITATTLISVVTTPAITTEGSSSRELPRETQVKAELEANILRREVKFDELDPNDSRISALDWLLHEDGMELQATSSNLGQRYILALLAFEFGDMFRSNNVDWLSSSMECSWDRVTCNGELKVTKLELGWYSIHYASLQGLRTNINTLESQNVTGTLPSEISGLESLGYLYISDNALFGTLPPEIGELTGLTVLYLWGNKLSEAIPTNIGDLINLQDLDLAKNEFTSSLPTELGALTELTEVRLWGNAFTGTIPSDFGDLTSLTLLSLSFNQLSGTMPSWIGEFKQLKELYLNVNQFTGPLPTELGQLTKLTQLWLNENKFTGKLPVELNNLEELHLLWIQNNQFTGAFEIDTSNLKDLCLDNNMFTGNLPSDIETDWIC